MKNWITKKYQISINKNTQKSENLKGKNSGHCRPKVATKARVVDGKAIPGGPGALIWAPGEN